MTTELKESEVSALRSACKCLYLEVPSEIADDVKAKAEAVITLLHNTRDGEANGSHTSEDGILIHRATFLVCDPCVKLEGRMCRTPECVFCFQPVSVARAVLNKTLNCPIIDGERFILLGDDTAKGDDTARDAGAQ